MSAHMEMSGRRLETDVKENKPEALDRECYMDAWPSFHLCMAEEDGQEDLCY